MTKLVLFRGLPGSGKSTMAMQATKESWKLLGEKAVHLEADMVMMIKGKYIFDPGVRAGAHTWCQNSARTFLYNGYNVFVSNTFTRKWEILPYKRIADNCECEFSVFTCTGNYGNVHEVPDEVIRDMRDRWENWE